MAKIVTDPSNNNTITTKARYWTAVCYPENMRPDWKERIGEILQLPYAYCVHDKDVQSDGDDRKAHVHIMVAWPNTTTYKAALEVFRGLSAPGAQCVRSRSTSMQNPSGSLAITSTLAIMSSWVRRTRSGSGASWVS